MTPRRTPGRPPYTGELATPHPLVAAGRAASRGGGAQTTTLGAPRESRVGVALVVLWSLWAVVLFDPQWWVAARGPALVLKLPSVLFVGLVLSVAIGVPTTRAWSRRWQWYVPFLCLIGAGTVTLPFALNNGYAREELQLLLLYWMLIVGTVALVDSARQAESLLLMYGLQFLWWGVWGARDGLVGWHHSYANYDAYGAFMVGGLTVAFLLGVAAPKGWFRRTMFAAAVLCTVGVVASFARGALLGAAAVFAIMWIRSPRKGATLLAGIGGALVILGAAAVLHPGTFWAEMQSAFTQGTTEGTNLDRWELWKAGWKVFLERPIFGVGPRNFGPFAASIFEVGDVGGQYAANPRMLYDRSLHSIYVQTLCELGIVGSLAFVWILADFWRRNAVLRSAATKSRWTQVGGTLSLQAVALGLEGSMVGVLVTGAVYPMLNVHWFYTLLALNLLLHAMVTRGDGRATGPRAFRSGSRRAGAPPG